MLLEDLPGNSLTRRVVVILKEQDIETCIEKGEARYLVRSPQVCFLRYDPKLLDHPSPILQGIISRNQYFPGNALVLNPFDKNSYEVADEAVENAAVKKVMLFSTLCCYLGATCVSIETSTFKTANNSIIFKGQAGNSSGFVKINAEAEYNRISQLYEKIALSEEYTGGEPEISKAEDFLFASGLSQDPGMRSLLELRRGDRNRIKHRRFSFNATSEVSVNISALLDLNIPSYVKVAADLKSDSCKKMNVEVEMSIDF